MTVADIIVVQGILRQALLYIFAHLNNSFASEQMVQTCVVIPYIDQKGFSACKHYHQEIKMSGIW
jgi:hypothetical protein